MVDSFAHHVFAQRLHQADSPMLERVQDVTTTEVERQLARPAGRYDPDRFAAFISPAAQAYLEPMAQQAHALTVQRFGKTVSLYAPLYLSSYCCNRCTYCGFNMDSPSERKRLAVGEAVADAQVIQGEGFSDLLFVSSEDQAYVTVDYLAELAGRLRDKFSSLSIEIQQLEQDEYKALFLAGIEGVTLYQETYDQAVYEHYHLAGPKADYIRRLAAPETVCAAGMRQVGIGSLLGLADWRLEALALAEHAQYLMKHFWRTRVSISFPRLRPANDVQARQFNHLVSDTDMVQMMLALRLCFADVGLVLSTRESQAFRDALVPLGITKMSAGSKTNPGGYSEEGDSVEQFSVNDQRSAHQIAEMLRDKGIETVWKDWDAAFTR